MTEQDAIRAETFAERRRLAGLLADLSPEHWASPSLCAGWRVREVVAHVTTPYRLAPEDVYAGLARHAGDYNRFADEDAREATSRFSDAELLALYHDNIENPWEPPGGGTAGALSHEVIHGLDITEALQLPSAPATRIAMVLEHAGPRSLEFFGTDLTGIGLGATDVDVTVGEGPLQRLPASEILLALTGRRPLPAPVAQHS